MRTLEKNASLEIQNGKAPNTEERSGSIVGAQSTNWDIEEADVWEDVSPHMVDSDVAGRTSAEHAPHNTRSRSRRPVENAWENGSPHMVDSHVEARPFPEHVSHSERSRSGRPTENGNKSSSTIPPTQGAKKVKASIAGFMADYINFMKNRQKPTNPPEEFSVSKCIKAMEEMVDITDDEKVLACDVFTIAVNREIFLSLNDTLRAKWLKNQIKKLTENRNSATDRGI